MDKSSIFVLSVLNYSGTGLWFPLMEENYWTNDLGRVCQQGQLQAGTNLFFCAGYKMMGGCQLAGPSGQLDIGAHYRQVCGLKVRHQPMLLLFHFCYEVLMGNGLDEVITFLQDHRMATCGTNR